MILVQTFGRKGGSCMFTVFVQDSSGDIIMQFNQCRHFGIIPYQQMVAEHPDILLKHGGMECSYFHIWDDCGEFYFPFLVYSAEIG